ncbi:MAG TPA: 6-carboxytetrahydropterin synthase QueD [Phycisphaerae bacterium]|nr:6-carboxytetrahydropterin synthase QueD [Phycisphaerae bacterium]
MAYELFIQADFSAAHNLREYKGKCERLHGHNWRVDLRLAGDRLDAEGLLLDFTEAKRILGEVLERFDHRYLNEVEPFDRLQPSSENIARVVAEAVAEQFPVAKGDSTGRAGVRVVSVTAWESDRCAATYSPPPSKKEA